MKGNVFYGAVFFCVIMLFAGCGKVESSKNSSNTPAPLLSVSEESPGENCLHGGIEVISGFDDNGDGILSDDEVVSIDYICNGSDGYDGDDGKDGADGEKVIVKTSEEPQGENCWEGGVKIEAGIDKNNNGVLDPDEVDDSLTGYVCDGAKGEDGKEVLAKTTEIDKEDEVCPNGGFKIEIGTDENRNGELDEEEVDHDLTQYVCNGEDGGESICFQNTSPVIEKIFVDGVLYAGSPVVVTPEKEIVVKIKVSDEDEDDSHVYSLVGAGLEIKGNNTVETDEEGDRVFRVQSEKRGEIFVLTIIVTDGCSIVSKTFSIDFTDIIIVSVSAGESHSCALDNHGQVYCWGNNNSGQLGNGSTVNSNVMVDVDFSGFENIPVISAISCGKQHTCAVDNGGDAYCWGYNNNGGLGDGSTTFRMKPVKVVQGDKEFSSISAGDGHTCAVTTDNKVYCWGTNTSGQLGKGDKLGSLTPVEVKENASDALTGIASVSAGVHHSCAVDTSGDAYCWGYNQFGQLGHEPVGSYSTFAEKIIVTDLKFTSISAGSSHTCAVTDADEVYCWGHNIKGQIGTGNIEDTAIPVKSETASVKMKSVSAGASYTCSLDEDGKVYCWGYNDSGQLGDGSTSDALVPKKIETEGSDIRDKKVNAVSSGYNHVCAVSFDKSEGDVYCWGTNENGALGNGTDVASSNVAVKVER